MHSFYASLQFDCLHKLSLTDERSTLTFITAIGKQTAFVKLPIHYDKNGVDSREKMKEQDAAKRRIEQKEILFTATKTGKSSNIKI